MAGQGRSGWSEEAFFCVSVPQSVCRPFSNRDALLAMNRAKRRRRESADSSLFRCS